MTDNDREQIERMREFLRIMGPPAPKGGRRPPNTPEQTAYLADPANRAWLGLPELEGS